MGQSVQSVYLKDVPKEKGCFCLTVGPLIYCHIWSIIAHCPLQLTAWLWAWLEQKRADGQLNMLDRFHVVNIGTRHIQLVSKTGATVQMQCNWSEHVRIILNYHELSKYIKINEDRVIISKNRGFIPENPMAHHSSLRRAIFGGFILLWRRSSGFALPMIRRIFWAFDRDGGLGWPS